MRMYIDYLRQERPTMMENNIRFKQIGRLENLPDLVLDEVNRTLAETAGNDGLQLNLALNYSSRAEITDAVRGIAAKWPRENSTRAIFASRPSATIFTPRECPIPMSRSAPPAKCASAIIFCGKSVMRNWW